MKLCPQCALEKHDRRSYYAAVLLIAIGVRMRCTRCGIAWWVENGSAKGNV